MVIYFECRGSLPCDRAIITLPLGVLSLPHRRSFSPPGSSYVGALRRPVEKENEGDDGGSDSEVRGDLLAARQISGGSEVEDGVSGSGGGQRHRNGKRGGVFGCVGGGGNAAAKTSRLGGSGSSERLTDRRREHGGSDDGGGRSGGR